MLPRSRPCQVQDIDVGKKRKVPGGSLPSTPRSPKPAAATTTANNNNNNSNNINNNNNSNIINNNSSAQPKSTSKKNHVSSKQAREQLRSQIEKELRDLQALDKLLEKEIKRKKHDQAHIKQNEEKGNASVRVVC